MPSFDLRKEPWITAVRRDGTKTVIGLDEALINAHDYVEYEAPTGVHYDTYAIYRLLSTIVTDIYRFKTYKHSARLFLQGKLDADRVLTYMDKYVWDIFDTERPFLQYPGEFEATPHPIASLSPLYQTGNNDIFHMRPTRINRDGINTHPVTAHSKQYNTPEWWNPFTPAEASCTLLRVAFSYGKYGSKLTTSSPVNTKTASPLMALAYGKNAFETIMLSTCADNAPGKGTVMWAKDHYDFLKDDPAACYLDTAFIPCMRIRLNPPEEDGLVYTAKYIVIKNDEKVWDSKSITNEFRQVIRGKEPNMLPAGEKNDAKFWFFTDITQKPWLNMLEHLNEDGAITREKNLLKAIHTELEEDYPPEYILRHDIFGLTMQGQDSDYSQMRCHIHVKDGMITEQWMQGNAQQYVKEIKNCAYVLKKMIEEEYQQLKTLGKAHIGNAIREFYDEAERAFDRYLQDIQSNGPEWQKSNNASGLLKTWQEARIQEIYRLCEKTYDRVPVYYRSMLRRKAIKRMYITHTENGGLQIGRKTSQSK